MKRKFSFFKSISNNIHNIFDSRNLKNFPNDYVSLVSSTYIFFYESICENNLDNFY